MADTIEKYTEKMKNICKQLLSLDTDLVEALMHGDPFDKLIRNMSTRNSEGEIFYNHKRMLNHYPRSSRANDIVNNNSLTDNEKIKLLYLEHDFPLGLIKSELKQGLKKKSNDELFEIVEKSLAVTLVTKEERREIDSKYKSTMPENGQNRYEATNITLMTKGL
ncbi:hypothetical protein [Geobacter sp. DSM 9736]|uniref:hypothetical protein n=1 Tax=Geobacter sp. DSM 9736 TaxID=1277350 RepID=UPI000B5100F3|nr:hypothetical protein [Geobacter sp. DSM 9736]SNB44939.1 hypothetical protein SAMN06269301_0329 [Geobacter sp. DSM 9736]